MAWTDHIDQIISACTSAKAKPQEIADLMLLAAFSESGGDPAYDRPDCKGLWAVDKTLFGRVPDDLNAQAVVALEALRANLHTSKVDSFSWASGFPVREGSDPEPLGAAAERGAVLLRAWFFPAEVGRVIGKVGVKGLTSARVFSQIDSKKGELKVDGTTTTARNVLAVFQAHPEAFPTYKAIGGFDPLQGPMGQIDERLAGSIAYHDRLAGWWYNLPLWGKAAVLGLGAVGIWFLWNMAAPAGKKLGAQV